MPIRKQLTASLALLGALNGCSSAPPHPYYSSIHREELSKEAAFHNTPEKIKANRARMKAEEKNSVYYLLRR